MAEPETLNSLLIRFTQVAQKSGLFCAVHQANLEKLEDALQLLKDRGYLARVDRLVKNCGAEARGGYRIFLPESDPINIYAETKEGTKVDWEGKETTYHTLSLTVVKEEKSEHLKTMYEGPAHSSRHDSDPVVNMVSDFISAIEHLRRQVVEHDLETLIPGDVGRALTILHENRYLRAVEAKAPGSWVAYMMDGNPFRIRATGKVRADGVLDDPIKVATVIGQAETEKIYSGEDSCASMVLGMIHSVDQVRRRRTLESLKTLAVGPVNHTIRRLRQSL